MSVIKMTIMILAALHKMINIKFVMTQSMSVVQLMMPSSLPFLTLVPRMGERMLLTLRAHATRAVVCSQRHPVAQPSSMFGLRSCTFSAALPLTVRTTHGPLSPLPPATINYRNKYKHQYFMCKKKCSYMQILKQLIQIQHKLII